MNTRSPRFAAVALLSAAFAVMAAGSSGAQEISNAASGAVRSAVTDARDATFRTRDAALHRDSGDRSRAHRRAAAAAAAAERLER
jgi:hypothetical protein